MVVVGSLATFGYGDRSIDLEHELQCVLRVNGKALIVDTRLRPTCDWNLWERENLANRFNTDDRKAYAWGGNWLGNLNYYKVGAPVCLVDEKRGIDWLVRGLEKGWTLILLCGCSNYLSCHRSYIYNKVKEALGAQFPYEYFLGQRVITPCGPGCIDPLVPLNVHRARNRYGVVLDDPGPLRYFFPGELVPAAVI